MTIAYNSHFLTLVVIDTPADWDEVFRSCHGYLSAKDLLLLRDMLSPHCQSVFVEYNYVDIDYRDTYSYFYSRKFASYPAKTIRLLFFGKKINQEQHFNIDGWKDSFIGYSVIRPTRINTIGRTVLDPRRCAAASGYVALTNFKVHFLGRELDVEGFPFISQDTDVTVCAHAACWMCFRYFSERYSAYKEVHPYQITQLTSDLSHGRLVPSSGLTMQQVSEMFSGQGFQPALYELADWGNNLSRYLYYYVESGLPSVIALPRHAAVAIGHISDVKKPVGPGALNSFHYVNGLVISDNGQGPYRILSADPELQHPRRSIFNLGQVTAFIVPLYEKIYLLAEHAEKLTSDCLADVQVGLKTLCPEIDIDDLTLRLFLTSSKSFKLKARCRNMPNSLGLFYSIMPMPKFIWVAELSTHDLYRQGQVLGEVLFDATANQYERFAFLSIHYPSRIIVNDRNSISDDPKARFSVTKLNERDPYPLYRNNLKEVP